MMEKYFTFHLSDFLILNIKSAIISIIKVTKQITKGDNAPMNNVILNTFDLKRIKLAFYL